MIKQTVVISALITATLLGARPAAAGEVNLLTIRVGEPAPHFEGRWYGRHEGRLGWWIVEHGRWRGEERREERREHRYYAWRR